MSKSRHRLTALAAAILCCLAAAASRANIPDPALDQRTRFANAEKHDATFASDALGRITRVTNSTIRVYSCAFVVQHPNDGVDYLIDSIGSGHILRGSHAAGGNVGEETP